MILIISIIRKKKTIDKLLKEDYFGFKDNGRILRREFLWIYQGNIVVDFLSYYL